MFHYDLCNQSQFNRYQNSMDRALQYVHEQTADICLAAVKQNGNAFSGI